MALSIAQTKTALGAGLTASFLASGGTPPYSYYVAPGGAGGSIDPSTGLYTAPATLPTAPGLGKNDIVVGNDSLGAAVTTQIAILDPLHLLLEIIKNEMDLDDPHCFLWDQKIFKPGDAGLYILASVPGIKVIGNNIDQGPAGWDQAVQYVSVCAAVDINVVSTDSSALYRQAEVLMALMSQYSEAQQEANSFQVSRIPNGFKNISEAEGPAIPYRYVATVALTYGVQKVKANEFYDTFQGETLAVNP